MPAAQERVQVVWPGDEYLRAHASVSEWRNDEGRRMIFGEERNGSGERGKCNEEWWLENRGGK